MIDDNGQLFTGFLILVVSFLLHLAFKTARGEYDEGVAIRTGIQILACCAIFGLILLLT